MDNCECMCECAFGLFPLAFAFILLQSFDYSWNDVGESGNSIDEWCCVGEHNDDDDDNNADSCTALKRVFFPSVTVSFKI